MIDMTPPHVILLSNSKTSTRSMAALVRAMLEDERFIPVLVTKALRLHGEGELLSIYSGARVYDLTSQTDVTSTMSRWIGQSADLPQPSFGQKVIDTFIGYLSRIGDVVWPAKVVCGLLMLLWERYRARQVFNRYRPAALLLDSDRHGSGPSLAYIHIARQRGVPSIVLPLAYSSTESTASRRLADRRFIADAPPLRHVKSWLHRRHPGLVHPYKENSLLFYDPANALALHLLGMFPEHPWTLGGGFSDRAAVAGPEDRDRYAALGVNPGKLVITGQPELDTLWLSQEERVGLKEELRQRYDLPADKPIAIYAIPQLTEHYRLDEDLYWEALNTTLETIAGHHVSLLLSLHPVSRPEDYRQLAAAQKAPILHVPLANALPAADVFLSSYSSTVGWAVLLQIPTILADLFLARKNLLFDMFSQWAGVVPAHSVEELSTVLGRLLADNAYYQEVAAAQATCATAIGPFDGRASQRIINLITDLSDDSVER